MPTWRDDELGRADSNDFESLPKPFREVVVFHNRDSLKSTERFKSRTLYKNSVIAEKDCVACMIIIPNAEIEQTPESLYR